MEIGRVIPQNREGHVGKSEGSHLIIRMVAVHILSKKFEGIPKNRSPLDILVPWEEPDTTCEVPCSCWSTSFRQSRRHTPARI